MTATLNGTTLESQADLDAQPVGTVMEYGDPGARRMFTKLADGQWEREIDNRAFPVNGFYNFPAVVILAPEAEEAEEEITPETHLTVAQLEAFPEGTVVADCSGEAHANEFVKQDGRWFHDGSDRLHNELVDIARHGEGGVRWRRWAESVLCSDEAHPLRIAELERLLTEARQSLETVQRSSQRQTERLQRLNTRLNQWADNESLDNDYDELMDEFSDIDMHGRDVEYSVDVEITCHHTTTVRARDEDAAYEQVIDATGFREGLDTRLYDENVTITNVSVGDIEEV